VTLLRNSDFESVVENGSDGRADRSVGVSVMFEGENKGLAGINEIGIPDPVSVCSVHERVSCAVAISNVADAPEAVAAGYDPARNRGARNRRRGHTFVRSRIRMNRTRWL
jgi:hypothetical protein